MASMLEMSTMPLATSQVGRPGVQAFSDAPAPADESEGEAAFAGVLESALGRRPSTGAVRGHRSAPDGSRQGDGDSDPGSTQDGLPDGRTDPVAVEATVGVPAGLGLVLEGVSWQGVAPGPTSGDGVAATGPVGDAPTAQTAPALVLGLRGAAQRSAGRAGTDVPTGPDALTAAPGSLPGSGERMAGAAPTAPQGQAGQAVGAVAGETGHGWPRAAVAGHHAPPSSGPRMGPDAVRTVSADTVWRLSMPPAGSRTGAGTHAGVIVAVRADEPVRAGIAAGDAEPFGAGTGGPAAARGSGEGVEANLEAFVVTPKSTELPAATGGPVLSGAAIVGVRADVGSAPAPLHADAAEIAATVTGGSSTPPMQGRDASDAPALRSTSERSEPGGPASTLSAPQAASQPTGAAPATDLQIARDDVEAPRRAARDERTGEGNARRGQDPVPAVRSHSDTTALHRTDSGVEPARVEPVAPSAVPAGATGAEAAHAGTRAVEQASRVVAEQVSRWVESSAHDGGARVRVVDSLLAEDGGELRLQLHPPELGEIRLRLRADGPRLVVQATVQQHETGWMLRHNSHLLERALEQAGLQLAGFSVEVGRHGHDGHPGPSPWGGARSEPLGASGVAAAGAPALAAPERPLWVRLGLGAVDVRV
ncbi:flagellar hook-length control protein FliK [Geochorda subterranea]|uniref:Flagellar hook-length control protein FliK n=1 Tax=Geochorda subterranea TaxID=3109564 RepID=A0ABZ1BL88_9FIRM|nr:flagellar hook-length control protein FliK [Limnochorda sp. LNt]WRP13335.1 flagellar hook-length control protein FliK [Limnochorda sp. LNt]